MSGFVNGPEDDEPGRANADMEFEDAMRAILNADLCKSGDDGGGTGQSRYIGPGQRVGKLSEDGQVNMQRDAG